MYSHDDPSASFENFAALLIELISKLNVCRHNAQKLALLQLALDVVSIRAESLKMQIPTEETMKDSLSGSQRGLKAMKLACSMLEYYIQEPSYAASQSAISWDSTCRLVAVELHTWLSSFCEEPCPPSAGSAHTYVQELKLPYKRILREHANQDIKSGQSYPRIEKVLELRRKKREQNSNLTEGGNINSYHAHKQTNEVESEQLQRTREGDVHENGIPCRDSAKACFQTRLLYAASSRSHILLSLGLDEASRVLGYIEDKISSGADEVALVRAARFLSHSDFRVRQRATSALVSVGLYLDRQALRQENALGTNLDMMLLFDEPLQNPKESIRIDTLLAMKHFLMGRMSPAFCYLREDALQFLLKLVCEEISEDLRLCWRGMSFVFPSKRPTQRFFHVHTKEPMWSKPEDEKMEEQENERFLIKFKFMFRSHIREYEV